MFPLYFFQSKSQIIFHFSLHSHFISPKQDMSTKTKFESILHTSICTEFCIWICELTFICCSKRHQINEFLINIILIDESKNFIKIFLSSTDELVIDSNIIHECPFWSRHHFVRIVSTTLELVAYIDLIKEIWIQSSRSVGFDFKCVERKMISKFLNMFLKH